MTLTELAKLAHVSTSTASKAFSMSSEVHEETRSMIFEVAKQNGCFKKFYRSDYPGYVVAVICPEFDSTYYSSFLSSLERELHLCNAEMTVAEGAFSCEETMKLIEYYDRFHTVDGIILINPAISELPHCEIPVAAVGSEHSDLGDIRVKSSSYGAMREGVSHLMASGVSRIGCIIDGHTAHRMKRLERAMTEFGLSLLPEDTVASPDRFERGGYLGMKELLKHSSLPRALFVAYDRMAVGAMRALTEAGLSVPDDVAIFSVDDAPQSEYMTPALTTINHSTELMAHRTVRALISKIRGEEYESVIAVESVIKLRETTKIL